MLVGPLSEVHGRSPVYIVSYGLFFSLSWAVAFPPHIGQFSVQITVSLVAHHLRSRVSHFQVPHRVLQRRLPQCHWRYHQ